MFGYLCLLILSSISELYSVLDRTGMIVTNCFQFLIILMCTASVSAGD